MGIADDAVEVRARGWRTLAALHGLIEAELERELQAAARPVRRRVHRARRAEPPGRVAHADAAAGPGGGAEPSATTRLVNRLEDRGLLTRILCADDRRGIYTELTAAGVELLEEARPPRRTLERALAEAQEVPELAPRLDALPRLHAGV